MRVCGFILHFVWQTIIVYKAYWNAHAFACTYLQDESRPSSHWFLITFDFIFHNIYNEMLLFIYCGRSCCGVRVLYCTAYVCHQHHAIKRCEHLPRCYNGINWTVCVANLTVDVQWTSYCSEKMSVYLLKWLESNRNVNNISAHEYADADGLINTVRFKLLFHNRDQPLFQFILFTKRN